MANAALDTFVRRYGAYAKQAAKGTGVFPETILAAAAHESGFGRSQLSSRYNNFFGIKASKNYKGKSVVLPTWEQDKAGKPYRINAPFIVFATPADSFRYYVKFISGPRYVKAGVLRAKTPADQLAAIKAAGYASDVSYVQKVGKYLSAIKVGGGGLAAVALLGVVIYLISHGKGG